MDAFKQYIPWKPDKYGMKVWLICNSSNTYPLFGIPYTGKEVGKRFKNLGKKVVLNLVKKYSGKNVAMIDF